MRSVRAIIFLVASMIAIGGCSGGGGGDSTDATAAGDETSTAADVDESTVAASADLREVTLRLNFFADVTSAPFHLAKARGFYEEAGLDVSIEPGEGSLVTTQTVARGADEFGYVTSDAAMRGISGGSPLKIVAALQRTSNMTVVFHPDYEVGSVADLYELEMFSNNQIPQWDALLGLVESQGGDSDRINIQHADFGAWAGLYEQSENGAVTGGLGNEDVQYKAIDDAQFVLYSDLGLPFLGDVLITSRDMIADNPEVVAGFAQATVRGWEEAIGDPAAAVEAAASAIPDSISDDLALEEAMLTKHLSVTKGQGDEDMEVKPTSQESIAAQLQFMVDYMGLETQLEADEYYTNEFLE